MRSKHASPRAANCDAKRAKEPQRRQYAGEAWEVLGTSAPTGAVKARYLRGTGLICQIIDLSVLYYVMNAHGDTVRQVRTNGTATLKYTYDAFGNQREPNTTDPNPFRYCGEYFDTETEEVYLRARYYNTATGRFGAEDPARVEYSPYSYCSSNPISRMDPTGLDSYLIYDISYMSEGGSMEERINYLESLLKEQFGTTVHLLPVPGSNGESFTQQWNKVGENGKNIESVGILAHGNPSSFFMNNEEIGVGSIRELHPKIMDNLYVGICNTAHGYVEDNLANVRE